MKSDPNPANAKSDNSRRNSAIGGVAGMMRIWRAFQNSLSGLRHAMASEAAIKQEIFIVVLAVPVSFVLATSPWVWLALMGALLFMLVVELLNTAIEKLCDHVTPDRHEDIKITKDVASAAVFLSQCLAGLIWIIALFNRIGLVGS